VQALTLIETLPVDLNDDLILDAEEFAAGREKIEWYLGEHYRFYLTSDGNQPLRGSLTSLEMVLDGNPELPSNYWLHAEFAYSADQELESVTIEESLFEISNPNHIEYLSVAWKGEEPHHHIFSGEDIRQRFEPTGREQKGVLRSFFDLGIDHILGGYDHLLFLVALLVGVKSLRRLVGVITAFTLAHSITLGLAAFEVVTLPSSFVEIAIALSIVYVAAENLLNLGKRSLWIEALVFGLLHGLGFAGFLGDALRGEESTIVPLLGFNAGVEVGQVLFVVPIGLLFHFMGKLRAPAVGGEPVPLLVPKQIGRLISIAVILIGMYWFVERAGFLS
jgi:hydrogenase/urease accessory protein HupE